MREVDLEWFGMKVKLALRELQGAAFQEFFADLMEAAHPGDFQRVRPYGKTGDLKCDGRLKSTGTIFQVYAPRATKEAQMQAKIKADFEGAKRHWSKMMEEWIFVHNDHDGLPAGVIKALDTLQAKHPHYSIRDWSPKRLEEIAMSIPRNALVRMFGRPPQARDFEQLGFEPVAKVLAAIRGQAATPLDAVEPVSPMKLQANALSEGVADYLKMGRRREQLVQNYLEGHPSPTLGEEIAAAFRTEYIRHRDDRLAPDDIFVALQAFAGSNTRGDPEHEAAVLAVLSYLFERCDIFEAKSAGAS